MASVSHAPAGAYQKTDHIHTLIREMERSGCTLIPRFLASTSTYLLTVKYQGTSFQITNAHRFPFQAAYDIWRTRSAERNAA